MDERSIAAVARVLARAEGADGEVTARHILTALTGLGWRRVIEPPPAAVTPVPATAEWKAIRTEAGK